MDIRSSLARRGIVALVALMAVIACLCLSSLTAPAAYANTTVNTKVGALTHVDKSVDNDYATFGYSVADNSIAAVVTPHSSLDYDVCNICVIGKKPGTTTVTVEKSTWSDEQSDFVPASSATYTINVSATSATVDGLNATPLYTGKKYTVHKLFSWSEKWLGGPITMTGTFVKGKGYKVYSGGKYVKFTKTGKVTVKFKTGGQVMNITVNAVHSKAKAKKAMKSKIKKAYGKTLKSISWKSFKVASNGTCTYKVKAKYDGNKQTITFTGEYNGSTFELLGCSLW